jgi:hypothetical protein
VASCRNRTRATGAPLLRHHLKEPQRLENHLPGVAELPADLPRLGVELGNQVVIQRHPLSPLVFAPHLTKIGTPSQEEARRVRGHSGAKFENSAFGFPGLFPLEE